ncbi:MAG: DUF4198 domain-containing protein [Acidobacteriota bacterium]
MMFRRSLAGGAFLALVAFSAQAHFQILFTEDLSRVRGKPTTLTMAFSHPVYGGPDMDMGEPLAFYVLSQRGDEGEVKRTDLAEFLEKVTWSGIKNESVGYRATLPRNLTRSMGDYVFVLEAAPYYEAEEDKYIQQFTRTILNVGGVPGNWAEVQNLPAEIQPLSKPYANWTGGLFRGIVLSEGKPVPFAEIEIEYLNYDIDESKPGFEPGAHVELPHPSYGNLSLRAGADGEFSVALPRAGWWGICALDVGPVKTHEGKPLSQDAVLWLEAKDVGAAD